MADTATKTRKPKAEKPTTEEKPEKKERAPKAEPTFSKDDVMNAAKEYSADAKEALGEFGAKVSDWAAIANADPKTYRDIITVVKFAERRVERMTLSLEELDRGLKERKPREVKPRPEGAKKPGRKPKVKEPEPEETDDEDTLDDDEDLDLDD